MGVRSPALALLGLALVLCSSAGCTGERPAEEHTCAPSSSVAGTEAIGLTASEDFTSSLALTPATGRPGGAEIEWMPVYSVTNLTDARICVHDITLDFPPHQVAGMQVRLESLGPSLEVALYHDLATLRADAGDWTVATQPLPFVVEPRATVMARLIQTYRFMVDGKELDLGPQDTLAEFVGPYLGLEKNSKGGRYHCDTVFTGLKATVVSDVGRSAHEVSHLLMPAGCIRTIPSR